MMRFSKVLATLALAMILIPGFLWASGQQGKEAPKAGAVQTGKVSFYTIDEWTKIPALMPYFKQLTDRFAQENPGSEAVVLSDPFGTWMNKILVMFAAGNAPDVVLNGGMFPSLANAGYLIDMTPLFDKAFFDDFPQAALATFNWKGKLQGSLPFTLDPKVLYYNKDLFRKAGLDPEKPPVTWDDFKADAKALSAIGVYGYAMGSLGTKGFPEEGLYCSTAAGPVTKYDANGNLVPNVNTAAFRGWLQLLVDLKPYYEPDFATVDHGQGGTLFALQKAGMYIAGPYIFDQNKVPYDTPWIGQALVPKPAADGVGGSVGGGFAIGINAATKYPQLAANLVKLIFWPGLNDKLMTNAPASIKCFAASDYAKNPFFDIEKKQMLTAYLPYRVDLTTNQVPTAVLDVVAQVLLGKTSIDDAIPSLEATLTKIIAEAK
jgi:ABC-type glycerol-3-phosphate transport system substrate-binding protein